MFSPEGAEETVVVEVVVVEVVEGAEETSINSGSNVRAKITHLLINGTYTQNKREMKRIFVITRVSCLT